MIKLVTCDIDGTLIKDYSKDLEPSFFDLIKKLKEKGVLFVATSGRQLPNLKQLFKPVQNEISYISENGALITHNNKTLYKSIIDNKLAKDLAQKILDTQNLEVLVCAANTTYVIPKCEKFLKHIQFEVKNDITIATSLNDIKEDILKVSIYEPNKITQETIDLFTKEFGQKFKHTLSGLSWYDFMNYNTHKGSAIEILQKEINVTKEETVAFGDNFNDIEMLKDAKYSFAMEDAHPDVKKYATYTCYSVEKSLNDLYNKFFTNS